MRYPVVNGSGGTTYPYSYDTMARQHNALNQLTLIVGELRAAVRLFGDAE